MPNRAPAPRPRPNCAPVAVQHTLAQGSPYFVGEPDGARLWVEGRGRTVPPRRPVVERSRDDLLARSEGSANPGTTTRDHHHADAARTRCLTRHSRGTGQGGGNVGGSRLRRSSTFGARFR